MQIAWINVVILCVLSVGHAALIVAVTNRVHAWPLPKRLLHRFRQGHDLVIVLLPMIFAWLAGFRGERLFFGGLWHTLPLSLLVYLAVCGAVALSLPAVALHRQLAAKSRAQLACQ